MLQVIIGSYRVLRQLSEGSFGRTYLGEHQRVQALACLKQEKTDKPEFKKLFREEAALLSRLTHESLPAFRDYYEDATVGQVMVMSFVDGPSLEDIVGQGGAVADEHICWILQRLLRALAYMHYHGVVHCDIKPANVLLRIPDHNAFLVDFGLSAVRPDAHTLAKGGTPFYLPPEFLQRQPPRPSSDLYSLGKAGVFLAGGNPATGALPKDMAPDLQRYLNWLTRRDPSGRPQSASEAHEALLALRQRVFHRTESAEIFQHRTGGRP